MEPRYALFIAHASLRGYAQLCEAMEKHPGGLTPVVIADAAKYGFQHALSRLYPGLVRSPFNRDPIPDIILALRYQFEDDPEGLGLSLEEADNALERRALRANTPASSGRLRASGTHPAPRAGDSSSRLHKLAPRPSIVPGARSSESSPPEQSATPPPPSSDDKPIPVPPSSFRQVGAGVRFPWEKRG